MHAVYKERENLVEYLLTCSNVNINYKDRNNYTALYYACRTNNIPILKLLLKHKDINVNVLIWNNERTVLHDVILRYNNRIIT